MLHATTRRLILKMARANGLVDGWLGLDGTGRCLPKNEASAGCGMEWNIFDPSEGKRIQQVTETGAQEPKF